VEVEVEVEAEVEVEVEVEVEEEVKVEVEVEVGGCSQVNHVPLDTLSTSNIPFFALCFSTKFQ
jgi:preprotein translocase subunit SecB